MTKVTISVYLPFDTYMYRYRIYLIKHPPQLNAHLV